MMKRIGYILSNLALVLLLGCSDPPTKVIYDHGKKDRYELTDSQKIDLIDRTLRVYERLDLPDSMFVSAVVQILHNGARTVPL